MFCWYLQYTVHLKLFNAYVKHTDYELVINHLLNCFVTAVVLYA